MSGRMKAVAAGAVIAVAIPVATVLGARSGETGGPGQASKAASPTSTAAVHRVASPSIGGSAAKGGGSKPAIKLAYFETKKKTVPKGKTDLLVGPVPKNCYALNGYYFIYKRHTTDIISLGDSPAGLRKWDFYRNNNTGKQVKNVTYGVICVKGAGVISQ